MLEALDEKGTVIGYVDGKKYLDGKKKKAGSLEGNVFKDKHGDKTLKIEANGEICMCEFEAEGDVTKPGTVKDGKIFGNIPAAGTLMYIIDKENGRLMSADGKVTKLSLRGKPDEIKRLTDQDYVGIAAGILELFSYDEEDEE